MAAPRRRHAPAHAEREKAVDEGRRRDEQLAIGSLTLSHLGPLCRAPSPGSSECVKNFCTRQEFCPEGQSGAGGREGGEALRVCACVRQRVLRSQPCVHVL